VPDVNSDRSEKPCPEQWRLAFLANFVQDVPALACIMAGFWDKRSLVIPKDSGVPLTIGEEVSDDHPEKSIKVPVRIVRVERGGSTEGGLSASL
jgi:hypothetical protein